MLTPLPLMSTSSPLAKYYTLPSWPLFSIISQWVLCFVAFNRQNLYQNITQSPMLQLPLLFVSFCYALVLFSPVMSFIWDGFYTSVVGGHVTGTQAWTLHCSHWLLSQSLFTRSVHQIPTIPCSAECSSLLPPQSVRYVQHTLLSVQYPQWYPLDIPPWLMYPEDEKKVISPIQFMPDVKKYCVIMPNVTMSFLYIANSAISSL